MCSGAHINAPDVHGYTPLHCAAQQGRPATVRRLLALGADAAAVGRAGETPEAPATIHGHRLVVDILRRHADQAAADGAGAGGDGRRRGRAGSPGRSGRRTRPKMVD